MSRKRKYATPEEAAAARKEQKKKWDIQHAALRSRFDPREFNRGGNSNPEHHENIAMQCFVNNELMQRKFTEFPEYFNQND